MPKKRAAPQRDYDAKMLKNGYTRATLWIPETDKKELTQIAVEMRQEYEAARQKS